MNEGDIFITTIPQDVSGKMRPVLFLRRMPSYNDILVCAISTQQYQLIQGFDLLLSETSTSFKSTGLLKTSVIRLSALAVLPSERKINNADLQVLKINLATYLLKK